MPAAGQGYLPECAPQVEGPDSVTRWGARPQRQTGTLPVLSSSVGVALGVWAGSTGVGLVPSAHAASFLETFGLSGVGGTVLGASTLPFYRQPGDHSVNLAWGAAVGAVVGLGVWWADRKSGAQMDLNARWMREFDEPRARRDAVDLLRKRARLESGRFASLESGSTPEPVRPLSLIAVRSP